MKVRDILTHTIPVSGVRTWLLIQVQTDAGITGWGEASQTRNDAAVARDVQVIKDTYIGKSPLDLVERSQHVLRWPYIGKSLHAAVSGIEQALWDCSGKKLDTPVYRLLGGAIRDRVRAYANIGYALVNESPEEYARVAREVVAAGFTAIKLYAFGKKPDCGSDPVALRAWLAAGVERVKVVRQAVGSECALMVDLMHQIEDFKLGQQIAECLRPYDLFWLEDPYTHERPELLARYRESIGPRLAVGAPCLDSRNYLPLLQGQAVDILMPDVKWIGGLLALKKAAVLADAHGVMCSPHNASGPIATAANVQACASMDNLTMLEYAFGAPDWRGRLCRNTEVLRDGHFVLTSRPGLGVDIDEEFVSALAGSHDDTKSLDVMELGASKEGAR